MIIINIIMQRIDCSVKMFEELLKENPHVLQSCLEYSVSIDGLHGDLVKDMIRGKRFTAEEPAVCDDKPFLLEVCAIIVHP